MPTSGPKGQLNSILEESPPQKPRLLVRVPASLLILTFLIIAAAGIRYTAVRADRAMREELLSQCRLVSQALSIDRIKSLSGGTADLTSHSYKRLKEALNRTCRANERYRFVYLLGRRPDGRVFFFLDSKPDGDQESSPPGELYDEASPELRSVFKSGKEIVEGPSSDRWGTWVSALVPLVDHATGRVTAVLGIDIDADAWSWEVAARSALPSGILILAIIVVGAYALSAGAAEPAPRPLTHRLLPPLAAMILAIVFGTGAITWQQERQRVLTDVRNELTALSDEFHTRINRQTGALRAILTTFTEDGHVQRFLGVPGFTGRSREWRAQFNGLCREFDVRELAFTDTHGRTRFAAQAPGKLCGPADSAAIARARKTRAPASGLEVGRRGVLLLRVAVPVYYRGSLVGYAQIGKDMKDILRNMHVDPRVDVAVVTDRKRLEPQYRDKPALVQAASSSRSQTPAGAVIYTSLDSLPGALGRWADHTVRRKSPCNCTCEIAAGGTDWRSADLPLRDAAGAEVADLLIMRNIAAEKAAFISTLTLALPAAGSLSAVLLAFVYVLVRRADKAVRVQESELRKSRAHLMATLQSIADGVIVTDSLGVVVGVNRAAKRLTRWRTRDAVGRPAAEVFIAVDSETGEAAENLVEQALGRGETVTAAGPIALVSRNGTKREVEASCSPINDAEGNTAGAVLVFRDVSKERRVQRLREVRLALLDYAASHTLDELLSRALDDISAVVESPVGFCCLVDPGQRTLSLQQWSSSTPPEFRRAECSRAHFPIERTGVWADAVREMKPVIRNDCDSVPNSADLPLGGAAAAREMVVPVIRDNVVVALLGVANKPSKYTRDDLEVASYLADVTWEIVNRKKAEQALAASEERYRSLFNQSRDAIVLLSTEEWRFISANPAAVELFGAKSAEDLQSRPFADTSPELQPDGTPTLEKASQMAKITLEQGTHFFEWTHKRLNGEEFPAQVLLSKIVTGGQTIFRGTVRDISREKEAQQELIEARNHLARTNSELKQALEKANTYAEEVTRKSLELNFHASHDCLTGLPNRRRFDESLTDLLAECAGRRSKTLVVMFVDLDRFKLVNDTLGHTVGDAVLVEVSRRLRNCLRSRDELARISGDEFAIGLHSVQNKRQAESVALRVIDAVSRPIDVNGNRLVIGATVGIAGYPADGQDPATLVRHADAAMYAAKKQASGTFRWYSGEIDKGNQLRLQTEQEIREALARDQFRVYYQPIIGVKDQSFFAVEALLRWEHPEKGIISPGLFIPIAEETGEIVNMGDYVLRTACRQLAVWRGSGIPVARVGVNVSVAQLRDSSRWLSLLREAIDESGISPESLDLEITENDFAGLSEHLADIVEQTGRLGVRIAIDDFGVGQSSFGRFKDLPLVHLKIDGSFVREVGYSDRDISIIRHIVRMAHEQGIEVTAEWVELESQYEILRECGCDYVQGYLISAPLTAEQLAEFARRHFESLRRAA